MIVKNIKHIDEKKLESDLGYRFGYVSEFMGFGEDDIAVIHASAEHIAPLVDAVVDAVYEKLFSYDATKRHFVPRNDGFKGVAPKDLADLTLDHEQITFRKGHLKNYLVKLVSDPYDDKMLFYLDMVGKMHTDKAGSNQIEVPLVQMNALMGFVSTMLLTAICDLPLDDATKQAAIGAFNKLMWLQNDMIIRWYV